MRALRTRGVGPLLVALIAACRTTPREASEPARGTEVWVERHYPSAGADTRPRPVAFRLPRPGKYAVRVRAISFTGIDRDVIVASGEQVHVNVQMRRPAYCSPVVTVSAENLAAT